MQSAIMALLKPVYRSIHLNVHLREIRSGNYPSRQPEMCEVIMNFQQAGQLLDSQIQCAELIPGATPNSNPGHRRLHELEDEIEGQANELLKTRKVHRQPAPWVICWCWQGKGGQ